MQPVHHADAWKHELPVNRFTRSLSNPNPLQPSMHLGEQDFGLFN
jgi:hypothetical protein